MIKKLKAYDKYPTAKLGMVLDSEWDVLSALHKALKWFKTYPKTSWVKSRQDDKVYDTTEMPLNAYLNSEADELATIGLKRLQEKPIVPMDPETVIQFHIRGRTITRDFNSIPVTVPLTGQLLGVIFLRGHISLKNRSLRPLLIERACPFKNMCVHT
jgi:hypothetical protein